MHVDEGGVIYNSLAIFLNGHYSADQVSANLAARARGECASKFSLSKMPIGTLNE